MQSKRILMIEDDVCLLEVIQYFLEMNKYRFIGFTETKDIVPLAQSTRPDLVLLDYLLPCADGGKLCSDLRKCPGFEHIPIVLISAYPPKQLPLDKIPFSAFIPKPFDLRDLLACLNKLLRHRVGAAA